MRFLSGFTSHSDEIRGFPKFCTRCLAPYICILLTANLHGAAAFHSPFGHTCSNQTERIRRTLTQTCPRAAPSVTACAVPPSSGRKALVFRANQTCLSLWERCRAATERAGSLFEGAGLPPCGKTEGAANYLSRIRQTLPQASLREFYKLARCA